MTIAATPLARFFETYQQANAGQGASVAALFADTFLAAGPDGARAVPATAFVAVLEKRRELFARLGSQPAELVALEESPLDSRYALAKTRWRMTFRSEGHSREAQPCEAWAEESFEVHSTFLVDLASERILVYLAHQDIFAILRERGILTE